MVPIMIVSTTSVFVRIVIRFSSVVEEIWNSKNE